VTVANAMPQINQLADVAYSQFFWLLLVLALIYFGIGRAMLPRIQSTVEARDRRIADDLAAAQAARAAADETEAAYRAGLEASRTEALKVAQAAKQSSARAAEERIRAANEATGQRVDEAEARIRAATQAALTKIEGVAAEAAREMVERLAGISVSDRDAAQAVKAAMADG
jgi:F-type H+-transporting ATPase subunit b